MAGEQAARAVELGLSKVGAPYVWATAGPDTFDCSGFTWWIASQIIGPQDFELRSSHHQFNVWGEALDKYDVVTAERIRAGDLLFFNTTSERVMGNLASHVGLYMGDGRMVHAANEDDGVIVSRPFEGWYGPRFIGARRIYDLGSGTQEITSNITGATMSFALPDMAGAVATPNQWNGGAFPAAWDAATQYAATIGWAAEEAGVDARVVAALGMMETQFTQYRDGQVLKVSDGFPADGPSIGIMQVKPQVWQWLRPDLDPARIGDNIRLGAAVIGYLIREQGGDLEAAVRRWYPGKDVERYVATFWGLMREMGYAS